jgi:hypothetical protein
MRAQTLFCWDSLCGAIRCAHLLWEVLARALFVNESEGIGASP